MKYNWRLDLDVLVRILNCLALAILAELFRGKGRLCIFIIILLPLHSKEVSSKYTASYVSRVLNILCCKGWNHFN